MVGTIGPVVRGARQEAVGLATFLVAGVLAGAGVGALAAGIGAIIPRTATAVVLLIVALLYGIGYVVSGHIVHIPGARQAPSRWIDHRHPIATAARFGAVMGAGVATPIRAGTVLAAVVVAALLRDPVLAAAGFGLMAAMRHVPVVAINIAAPASSGRAETILKMTRSRWLLEAADLACLLIVTGALLWHYPLVS